MKNIESLDKVLSSPIEPEVVEPTEKPSELKPSAKAKRKRAKVLSYNKSLNIIAYEFEGVTYQSDIVEYDGESEYIEI